MLSETALLKLRTKTVKVLSNDTVDSCCVSPTSPRTPTATTSIRNIDSSCETNIKPSLLLSLPITVIVQMMSYLSAFELLRLSETCSTLRTLVLNHWELWRNLLRNQQNLSLFNYKIFISPQIHCNHCSAAAFQTSPTCPSQALNFPVETRKLLSTIEYPDWLRGYIKVHGLTKNWMTGRYHPINSRCHTKHVTGVVANKKSILSSGKDGYVFMYSRDFFVHYKLIKLESEILCMQLIGDTMICFVDKNGFLHLVDIPPKLPSNPREPPVSKFWTCPIADSDTKALIITEIKPVPSSIAEQYYGFDENTGLMSLLAVSVSYHSSVSVVRTVLRVPNADLDDARELKDYTSDEYRWPNLDSVITVDVVQRFQIASDDTERVFVFTCNELSSNLEMDLDKLLFVSAYDCPIAIYQLMTAECLRRVRDVADVVYCGAFNPWNGALYTGGADGKLIVWSVAMLNDVSTENDNEEGHDKISSHVASDGTRMTLSLLCEQVMNHPPEVYCLDYFKHPHTSEEIHLVSGGSDGDVKIWHSKSGHLMRVLRGHVGIVRKLVIQRGRQLISTGDQKRIIIWNLSVARTLQNVLCNKEQQTASPRLQIEQTLITDAGNDDEKEAIVLHRNPICIDSLFVDDFSIFIGSPDYPGSVGAILFW